MPVEIDLTNPKLGAELLKDAKGYLPVDVWMAYVWQHSNERHVPSSLASANKFCATILCHICMRQVGEFGYRKPTRSSARIADRG
jgi:hypothetical protein